MNDLTQIKTLILNGAKRLYQSRICDEDHLPHGRRAYVWPLLKWLYQDDGKEEWQRQARAVADELEPTVRKNRAGEMVIFPGLHHRRNYSTNAIDCGTFVDSFCDFMELRRGEPHPLESKVRDMAAGYILKKITGHKDVHDQYLWAATGLARFLEKHPKDPEAKRCKRGLEETLDFWVRHQEEDGYSPYMNSDPFMGGLTPYYFSRRIAFSWYILEKAKLKRPDIEEKLLKAAHFLVALLKTDGTKEMGLEAKRYYFWGSYEADSHPFDIYVFYQAYERTKNDAWIDISAASLRWLMKAQTATGAIQSRASEPGVRDWQCDTMRTGHLAWLTRVPREYLAEISHRDARPLRTTYNFSDAKITDRILLIGNERSWLHFVTRKGPIAGHAGERSSGLIPPRGGPVTDLQRPCLFHYRSRGNPLLFLKDNRGGVFASFQYALFHVWDCLYHKRAFHLALAFLRDGLLGYLWTGLFVRSTEFATQIPNLNVGKERLSHDLLLCDLNGNQKSTIGRRVIRWDDAEKIVIVDTITSTDALSLLVPEGTRRTRGHATVTFTYPLRRVRS